MNFFFVACPKTLVTHYINPLGPKITYKIYSTGIAANNYAPTACIAAR